MGDPDAASFGGLSSATRRQVNRCPVAWATLSYLALTYFTGPILSMTPYRLAITVLEFSHSFMIDPAGRDRSLHIEVPSGIYHINSRRD